jgi:cytoskeletal protein RodZ
VIKKHHISLIILALFLSPVTSWGAYKWVDEQGNTHFTEHPPTGQDSEYIGPARSQQNDNGENGQAEEDTAAPEEAAAGETSATEEGQKAAGEEKAQTTGGTEDEAALKQRYKRNCAVARSNLDKLMSTTKIRYKNDQGEVIRMPDEERLKKIEDAKRQIKEFCK